MRVVKLTLAYDGTRFVGWQRQPTGESIQGIVEDLLAEFEGAPVTLHGAGRTDAGVHALGQVASVRLTCGHDVATLRRALNAKLPTDIRVVDVQEAAPDFHARFRARTKTYRYVIRAGTDGHPFTRHHEWQLREALDLAAMRQAAAALVGEHDFRAFQSVGTPTDDTVRRILRSTIVTPPTPGAAAGTLLEYDVTGTGFLRHMVRAIVGTLVEVGRGWRSPDLMEELLHGGTRHDAGATAPPHGLFLVSVDYD